MKKGTLVSWQIENAMGRGQGVTCSDEDEMGTILVAVNNFASPSAPGSQHIGYHPVIHCTITWLTVEQTGT